MAWLDRLVLGVMTVHLIVCPFTKVEESFNLQAMHDILYHGLNISQYDHLEFPGVVPRTFIGPLAVCLLAIPAILTVRLLGIKKIFSQYFVRFDLGLMVFYALLKYKGAVSIRFGSGVGRWLMLICASQFHFMFYMTRPLPNVFALILVLLSIRWCLLKEYGKFIWSAGCSIIIFRSELAILMGLILLSELVAKRISIVEVLKHIVPAGVVCLGCTIAVDSYFWQRVLWPEGEVFWYNTVLNKSSNWGTMPFLWYFYSALPRALSTTSLLVLIGIAMDKEVRRLVLPALLFVFLYSFLPHKELRFIIYVIPILNTAAASACQRLWQTRSKTLLRQLLGLLAVGHLLANVLTTSCFLYISYKNYPGGWAMTHLHQHEVTTDVHLHIDVATAQTGVSRFTQIKDSWRYDKTEDLVPGGAQLQAADYLFIGATSNNDKALEPYKNTHEIFRVEYGFSRVKLDLKRLPFIHFITEPKIYILRNLKTKT